MVSDVEKARVTCQVGIGKASASDSLLTCRNRYRWHRNRGVYKIPGGVWRVPAGQAVSGMEATRARSAASAWNGRRPNPILLVRVSGWVRGSSPCAARV